jgi:hypothetical protein
MRIPACCRYFDRDPRLRASDAFLMEALSTFELVSRGYVDLADRRDRR